MRKRFSESEIINLLRAIEVKISGGMGTEEACRILGVSDKSYYRWRKLYGSMGVPRSSAARTWRKRMGVYARSCRILSWIKAF